MVWLIWLSIALIALLGEAFSLSLVLGSLAGAALITAALSAFAVLPIQIATFVLLSVVFLIGVRPAVLRLLPDSGNENIPALPARLAIATETITEVSGQVRIGASEFWTARAVDDLPIPAGSIVRVVRREGLTLLVQLSAESVPAAEALPIPGKSGGARHAVDNQFGLSAREIEVLRLLAAGRTNEEIARILVVSPRTVHHHVSHILEKMGASSRTEAARLGIEHGLVQLDHR